MIVYVESNFVLEIALQQEQSSAAANILNLAAQGKITFAFPVFALNEPFSTIMHRNGERKKIANSLAGMLREISRSKPHERIIEHVDLIISALRGVESQEWGSLHKTVGQLLHNGTSLPLAAAHLEQAAMYRAKYDLASQDALIYASIVADMQVRPHDEEKCFLSRDRKAFGQDDDRGIKAELDSYNCRYIGNFMQGFEYIQNTLQSAG